MDEMATLVEPVRDPGQRPDYLLRRVTFSRSMASVSRARVVVAFRQVRGRVSSHRGAMKRIHLPAPHLHRRGHLQWAVVVKAAHRRTPQRLPEPRRDSVQHRVRPRRSGRARAGIRCEVFQEVGHKLEFTSCRTKE